MIHLENNYKSFLVGISLIIFVIGVILFPINNISVKNSNVININEESESYKIKAALNDPPNKGYFKYYKIITIPHEQVFGIGTHSNFPVLISILDSDLRDDVQSNGNDIAFANDTDWLDYEIEVFNQTYNGTHAQLIAWVRISSLSTSSNTIFYMYYGNSTMTPQENPSNVWLNYTSVWHLNENSGSGYYLTDSTVNNYDGIPSGTEHLKVGKIGGARSFTSDTDGITINSGSDLLNGNSNFMFSFWMYPNYTSDLEWENVGEDFVFYKSSSVRMARTWRSDWQSPDRGTFQADIEFDIDGTNYDPVEIYRQTWNYFVYTYDGYWFRIYINGQQASSTQIESDNLISDSSTFVIGTAGGNCFNGFLDEFRISNQANPIGWYQTEFNNQNNTESFVSLSSEFSVDIKPPLYSNLTENADPLELGNNAIIQINISDSSGILQVLIEFEGSNRSMNNLEGELWQYNAWIPNVIGNYSYKIYMQDNMLNWNSTSGTIEVIDTTPPNYSNLFESADPLELGHTETIQINISDFAGISQVLIEFDGFNHSMVNIGGNIWEYNSWTPTQWIIYNYKIYMQDVNGNWNSTNNSINVQDTIRPQELTLNNAPSGNVNGNLVFDWSDGNDPSGISYYVLIISNQSDPSVTQGYVHFINITNIGPTSSYYELTETLPSGKYYYFLAQVDGAGHQSIYTQGSFTINFAPIDDSMIYIVIIIISVISVIGSITGIVVMRKKSQKQLRIPRKKIPLKLIISHINQITPPLILDSNKQNMQEKLIQKIKVKDASKENLMDEKKQHADIEKIKNFGEELFKEGAYLEAMNQFERVKNLLLIQGKEEEVRIFTELIDGIKSLIEEREKRIEALDIEKNNGNAIKIFELYQEIIKISEKLKDLDGVKMFKSEMIDFYNNNKIKLLEIQRYRNNLEKEIDVLIINEEYQKATQDLEICEQITKLIIEFNQNEIINVEKFKNKQIELLEKLKENRKEIL